LVMPNCLNLAVLAGFVGSMAAAAFEDCRRLIIPNELIVGLCVLWLLRVATVPDLNLAASLAAIACAAAIFAAGALLFSRGLMGGGDVKLLAAAALWAGPHTTPVLLLTTAILGGLLTLVLLCLVSLRRIFAPTDAVLTPSRIPVPYGVAIAAAALIVTIPPHFA
jgi:prepilin peptidase CpaA